MPTRYDRSILQSHADALYEQADNIVWSTAVSAAVSLAAGSGAMGVALAFALTLDMAGCVLLGVLVGAGIGFAWGWQLGQEQAFKLRLRAQEVLCRMMTEKNTANLLRLALSQSGSAPLSLDEATLESLRPGRSLRSRMGRLGQ